MRLAGCGKSRDFEKWPWNGLDTEMRVTLDQWLTDVLRAMNGSETTINRLFPHPARVVDLGFGRSRIAGQPALTPLCGRVGWLAAYPSVFRPLVIDQTA